MAIIGIIVAVILVFLGASCVLAGKCDEYLFEDDAENEKK